MSKQVMIKDDTYNKLKELADAGYRSISAQIDMLLEVKPAPGAPATQKSAKQSTSICSIHKIEKEYCKMMKH